MLRLYCLQWYTDARQRMAGGLQQFLGTAAREAGELSELCERVQVGGRMGGKGDLGVCETWCEGQGVIGL